MHRTEKLFQLLALAIGLASVYFIIKPPVGQAAQTRSLILFVAILGAIALFYAASYVIDSVKLYTNLISEHSHAIVELESELDSRKELHALDKRLSVLEARREH